MCAHVLRRSARARDRRPEAIGSRSVEKSGVRIAVFPRRQGRFDRFCENVREFDPERLPRLRRLVRRASRVDREAPRRRLRRACPSSPTAGGPRRYGSPCRRSRPSWTTAASTRTLPGASSDSPTRRRSSRSRRPPRTSRPSTDSCRPPTGCRSAVRGGVRPSYRPLIPSSRGSVSGVRRSRPSASIVHEAEVEKRSTHVVRDPAVQEIAAARGVELDPPAGDLGAENVRERPALAADAQPEFVEGEAGPLLWSAAASSRLSAGGAQSFWVLLAAATGLAAGPDHGRDGARTWRRGYHHSM
jgi:hypothetical protein